ncbi:hypothetical protein FGW20_10100 [Methanoculleus sp. FWC-SCC3]|uniref:Uncharacterized protein n=1 Tax=Methanoculleus methanifontis TaxID=2584086 RepID=A0ABT8M2W7_9EURY|nr:hypothetical protein [Methanoculleus sp. FWC-SCC3]MDN7013384.1 hypothetical protein [Methanoculleus sp. FWC-SCC3]
MTIDLPEEIPAKDAEIFATITSNQTEHVHMILYNYDVLSNNEGIKNAKLEGLVMTQTDIENIFTSGELKIGNLGTPGGTIAVVVIAYDENNTPIASITKMGTLQG